MRNPLCVLGWHNWRTEQRFDQPDYVVCIRERCRRYRNDGETVVFGRQDPSGPQAWGGPTEGGSGGW